MAFGKGVPDLPYGQDRTTQDMADTYYGISEALAPQLLPGYLQREPVNALDPYAHSGIDEPWEMIHDAPVVPENIPGRGYSNMQLGDKLVPWLNIASVLLGNKLIGKGPQLNPTVPLRAPANTDLVKSTQAPGWMRPVVDEARLPAYAKDPLGQGAANLYAPTHGQITSPWRASELERQMLAAQYGAAPVYKPVVRMNEYKMLDDLPMADVPRTAELARRSNLINQQQVAAMIRRNDPTGPFAPTPFPIITPPAYAPYTSGRMAGIGGGTAAAGVAGGAGFGLGDISSALGGLLSLLPMNQTNQLLAQGAGFIPGIGGELSEALSQGPYQYGIGQLPRRDENTPYEKIEDSDTNWREVWNDMLRGGKAGAAGIGSGAMSAAKAGGADLGLGDLAEWLWSQTAGKGY